MTLDLAVGIVCLAVIPAVTVVIFVCALRGPVTDTDRYCAAVDAELDAHESRRRDHTASDAGVAQPVEHRVPSAKVAGSMPAARFPLASPCRGASRGSSPRGSGSRQPSERLAGSNPFPFDWPER